MESAETSITDPDAFLKTKMWTEAQVHSGVRYSPVPLIDYASRQIWRMKPGITGAIS